MREIKFRGRCNNYLPEKRRFVYGSLTVWGDGRYSIRRRVKGDNTAWKSFGVLPESIGQYTGIKDKNGKDIYEGDIVRYRDPDFDEFAIGVVTYYSVTCSFVVAKDIVEITSLISMCEYEVIGNIYDNPELLKTEES